MIRWNSVITNGNNRTNVLIWKVFSFFDEFSCLHLSSFLYHQRFVLRNLNSRPSSFLGDASMAESSFNRRFDLEHRPATMSLAITLTMKRCRGSGSSPVKSRVLRLSQNGDANHSFLRGYHTCFIVSPLSLDLSIIVHWIFHLQTHSPLVKVASNLGNRKDTKRWLLVSAQKFRQNFSLFFVIWYLCWLWSVNLLRMRCTFE